MRKQTSTSVKHRNRQRRKDRLGGGGENGENISASAGGAAWRFSGGALQASIMALGG